MADSSTLPKLLEGRMNQAANLIVIFFLKFSAFIFISATWSVSFWNWIAYLEYSDQEEYKITAIAFILLSIVITWLLKSTYFSSKYIRERGAKGISHVIFINTLIAAGVIFCVYFSAPKFIELFDALGVELPEITTMFVCSYKYFIIFPSVGCVACVLSIKNNSPVQDTTLLNTSHVMLIATNTSFIFNVLAVYTPQLNIPVSYLAIM